MLLTVKNRPKEITREEYQRVMGTIIRQITNDSGISIMTKNGNRYTGEAVKLVKEVTVEKTTGNRIVEEQLKQKMESFLTELGNSTND